MGFNNCSSNSNPQETNRSSGGYKELAIFKQATVIHDFTVEFVKRYINQRSRTKDQMEQAARSGKQNIAEGYLVKSTETRLKLLSVSRGSLEELLNDYLDFLRQHEYQIWDMNSAEGREVRGLVYQYNRYNYYNNYNLYKVYLNNPEQAANVMVCLVNQTNRLLDQKYRWTEEKFVKEGGVRENLLKKRLEYRRST